MSPTVELVYDKDCPNVAAARANLLRAFAEVGMPARWTEWEQSSPEAPARLRGFGSPTVLVEGHDVAGAQPVEGLAACRLYDAADGRRGVPPVKQIASAISPDCSRTKQRLSVLPRARGTAIKTSGAIKEPPRAHGSSAYAMLRECDPGVVSISAASQRTCAVPGLRRRALAVLSGPLSRQIEFPTIGGRNLPVTCTNSLGGSR